MKAQLKRLGDRNSRIGKVIKGKGFEIIFHPNASHIDLRSLDDHKIIPQVKTYAYTETAIRLPVPSLLRKLCTIPGVITASYSAPKNSIGIVRDYRIDWGLIVPNAIMMISKVIPRNNSEHHGGYDLALRAKSDQPTSVLLDSLSKIGTVYSLRVML